MPVEPFLAKWIKWATTSQLPKIDTFTGYDMNQFLEWVAQFLSGVNLFQRTKPSACKVALHLLRGKAAKMAKNIPQQLSMTKLQELLTGFDKIFNTTGNRIVALNLSIASPRERMCLCKTILLESNICFTGHIPGLIRGVPPPRNRCANVGAGVHPRLGRKVRHPGHRYLG